MKKRIIAAILAFSVMIAALSSFTGCTKQYTVANFIVYTEDVEPVELESFIGKPIVVNFWATWCYYCKIEMPDFNEAYHANPDVEFLMVNYTQGDETIEKASAYVRECGFDFPVYYDAMGDASDAYEVEAFPTTLFISRSGDLLKRVEGTISAEKLAEYLELIK